jgi:hypothetical protein
MPVYITQDLYLSGALDDGYINANNPRIGYEDLLASGAVASTYAEADYPASNLQNVSSAEYWQSTDNFNVQYLTMQVTPSPVNYFAIAGHNLRGAELKLQYRLDPGDPWIDKTDPVIPGDNNAIMWLFGEEQSASYWRLYIEPDPGVYPRIAVAYLGPVLTLQRRTYVGHKPVTFNRSTNVVSGMSESGQYLGRVVRSRSLSTQLSQQNVDPAFYREYIDPFAIAAQTRPFFMAWRPSTYPEEIGFCWLTKDITLENQLANGFVKFDITCNALAPLTDSIAEDVGSS